MGKVKKAATTSSLGRSLIKDKSKRNRGKKKEDGWLHTSELSDGYDWGRLNLQSVTEESDLNEFLSTAKLAGTEFTAEKLNISFVTESHNSGLPTVEESEAVRIAQEEHRQYLSVPRRPSWDNNTTSEELAKRELDSFLTWRRNLAKLQEDERLILTPFEKNLDFWRQLWRVIERSDVVVQIVDSRNPLLFRCEDLETYVKEVCSRKENMLLLSKADLLTPTQRDIWANYFDKEGVSYAFWSAHLESSQFDAQSLSDDQEESCVDDGHLEEQQENVEDEGENLLPQAMARSFFLEDECATMTMDHEPPSEVSQQTSEGVLVTKTDDTNCSDASDSTQEETVTISTEPPSQTNVADDVTNTASQQKVVQQLTHVTELCNSEQNNPINNAGNDCGRNNGAETNVESSTASHDTAGAPVTNPRARLLSCSELLDLFRSLCSKVVRKKVGEPLVVGMVGYPNVGKSSTINTLIQVKKVPVSATPGRTKHFQTLYAAEDIMLCDCPGLVFPSFISTKAEMVCSGILPIDQMRDYLGPVSLVCHRIPRHVLETTYGILLPKPREGEDKNRSVYTSELLNAYGYARGFMTSHGQPDCSRASRYVLKDYVMGRLLYCFPPPDFDQSHCFNSQLMEQVNPSRDQTASYDPSLDLILPSVTNRSQASRTVGKVRNPDALFLYQERVSVHSKGHHAGVHSTGCHDKTTGEVDRQDNEWEQGSCHDSTAQYHMSKPWKKHHNKHKNQKVKNRMKKIVDS